jgi:hypothetical protein
MVFGIHNVFPVVPTIQDDPISYKKLMKQEGHGQMIFKGNEKTIWLLTDKRDALIATL